MSQYPPPPPLRLPISLDPDAPYNPFSGHTQYHRPQGPNSSPQAQGRAGVPHMPQYSNAFSFSSNGQGRTTPTVINGAMVPPPYSGLGRIPSSGVHMPSPLPVSAPQQPPVAYPAPQIGTRNDTLSMPLSSQHDIQPPPRSSTPEPYENIKASGRGEPRLEATADSDLEEGELTDEKSNSSSEKVRHQRMAERADKQIKRRGGEGREVARNALRELEENKITFLSVAAEVVDEHLTASSLQTLYFEIGVSVSPADLAAASVYNSRPKQPLMSKKTKSRDSVDHAKQLGQPLSISVSNEAPVSVLTQTNSEPKRSGQEGVNNKLDAIGNTHQSNGYIAIPATTLTSHVSNTTTGPTRSSIAKPNEKPFDRKDYIARMLAAKAGKVPSALENVDSNDSSINLPTSVVAEPSLTNGVSTVSRVQSGGLHLEDLPTIRSDVALPQSITDRKVSDASAVRPQKHVTNSVPVKPADEADAQAKKKAQTELARQKMEALRNRERPRKEFFAQTNALTAIDSRPSPAELITSSMSSHEPVMPTLTQTQAASSPQRSLFSPVSAKPLFSLPGLFMDSEPPDSLPNLLPLSQPSISNTSATAVFRDIPTTTSLDSLPNAGPVNQPVRSSPTLSTEETSTGRSGTAYTNMEIVNNTRKRQKASDFIEPLSTRKKRYLGPSEDKEVVIEVSEDEILDNLADNNVDVDVDTDQDIYGTPNLKPANVPRSQQKGVMIVERRGSDLNRRIPSFTLPTPPLPSTPGSGGEVIGLRSKEKEIELMNQKIAELEQRRKAKHITSRAQTPSAANRSSSPKAGKSTSDYTEKSLTALSPNESLSVAKHSVTQKEPDIAPSQADQASQSAGLLSTKQAAQVRDQCAGEREAEQLRDLHRLGQNEIEGQELETQRLRVEQQQAKDLEEGRVRQLEEERLKQLEEQRAKDLEQKLEQIEEARLATEQQQALEAADEVKKQQMLERRAAIQAGLPVLDAEVKKTEQKLQLLREQIEELERELERGREGRRVLVDELQNLQIPPDISPEPTTEHSSDDENEEVSSIDSADAHPSPGSPKARPLKTVDSMRTGRPTADKSQISEPANHNQIGEVTATAFTGLTSDGEHPEDVMDISRSDVDESEITQYSPGSTVSKPPTANHTEHDDIYEPPPTIGIESALPSQTDAPKDPCQPSPLAESVELDSTMNANILRATEAEVDSGAPTAINNIAKLSNQPSHQPSLADVGDDSDDYEPPEPVSPAENISTATAKRTAQLLSNVERPAFHENLADSADKHQALTSILHSATSTPDKVVELQPGEKISTKLNNTADHFTPYDSPLRRFKSYRYHPAYAANVRDGFRSLTYSHDIDPNELICPYETSGTCNDDSCKYQHLKRVKLSDDMILVQLGAAPSGLSHEEQDAYSQGLREVIRDIRARNIKDFNTVAAEITAYRQKFLGDPTKVLPL